MKYIHYLFIFCSYILLFTGSSAFACSIIPEAQSSSVNDLVNRTENIVLARVKRLNPDTNNFHIIEFEVDEILKGAQTSNFTLRGKQATGEKIGNDFNKHNNLQFLAYLNTGNFFRAEDCNLYGYYEVNRQYLIFLETPHHPKSFELISSYDDSWLNDVKKQITKAKP